MESTEDICTVSQLTHFSPWKLQSIRVNDGFFIVSSKVLAANSIKYPLHRIDVGGAREELQVEPNSASASAPALASAAEPLCLRIKCNNDCGELEHEITLKFKTTRAMRLYEEKIQALVSKDKEQQERRALDALSQLRHYIEGKLSVDQANGQPPHAVAVPAPVAACSDLSTTAATLSQPTWRRLFKIAVPKLNIVMMVVGTRGDVQPFAQLGIRLLQDGHRVRLATHACFRDFVIGLGLEYYPLGGDPQELSKFMCTGGSVFPSISEMITEVPKYKAMLKDIIYSCWGAAVSKDPHDEESMPFAADMIIANPVSYGHIHCAEALGVPLHLMFPQQWIPTRAYPHPLCPFVSYNHLPSSENFISYQLIDRALWLFLSDVFNSFRKNILGLKPLVAGEEGWNLINSHKVPFAKMWSPYLLPRPQDYPKNVHVVGSFFEPIQNVNVSWSNHNAIHSTAVLPSNQVTAAIKGDQFHDIASFLAAGAPPIFVGFGSMMLDEPESVFGILLEAAAQMELRIIIQTGWTQISRDCFQVMCRTAVENARRNRQSLNMQLAWDCERDAILIGPCPHSWLFQHVLAVCHHGGCGSTAEGLRFGKPTWVCPFFGDQFLWGAVVERNGYGPKPVPVKEITLEKALDSFGVLLDPLVALRAKDASVQLQQPEENGVENCVQAVYGHLPLEAMICDVSLFLGKVELAQVHCEDCAMNLSSIVSDAIHAFSCCSNHVIKQCRYVDWNSARAPVKLTAVSADSVMQGVANLINCCMSDSSRSAEPNPNTAHYDRNKEAKAGINPCVFSEEKSTTLEPNSNRRCFAPFTGEVAVAYEYANAILKLIRSISGTRSLSVEQFSELLEDVVSTQSLQQQQQHRLPDDDARCAVKLTLARCFSSICIRVGCTPMSSISRKLVEILSEGKSCVGYLDLVLFFLQYR